MLPLKGLRILGFESWGAGSYGNMMLAQLGAEVISIENPETGGNALRSAGPFFFDSEKTQSESYQSANQNKRSLTINLKTPQGQEILHKLVKTADATLDNLRGDVPDELGITYEALKEYNPLIVCAHISGYGRKGPRHNWPGYDFLMQAENGWMSLTGEPDGIPSRVGVSVVDIMGGVYGAMGLLAAVIGAKNSGKGMDIDTNLFDVALSSLTYEGNWYLNDGNLLKCQPRSAHASQVPSQIYKTSDGWIYIACLIEKFWVLLCEKIERIDLLKDERFIGVDSRMKYRDELTEILDDVFSKKTKLEWQEALGGSIPCAPVNNIAETLTNPYIISEGKIVEIPHPEKGIVKLIGCPFHLKDQEIPVKLAPDLGESNQAILNELGYDDDNINELKRLGII